MTQNPNTLRYFSKFTEIPLRNQSRKRIPGNDFYILEAPTLKLVKIGISRDTRKRLSYINFLPIPITRIAVTPCISNGEKLERAFKRVYAESRYNNTEWFHVSFEKACEFAISKKWEYKTLPKPDDGFIKDPFLIYYDPATKKLVRARDVLQKI